MMFLFIILIKNGKNGFVLDLPPEVEALAVCVQTALSNLKTMSRLARSSAEKFSIENSIKKLVELLKCVS